MGLGMHLVLLRLRRNRCAPFRDFGLKPTLLILHRRLNGRCQIWSPALEYNPNFCWRWRVSMELKTSTLDRVLEALSPTLATEIDRVVQETREEQEQEFHRRLETALREAESTSAAAVEAQTQRALIEAAEMMRKQVSDDLEQQFQEKLDAAVAQVRSDAAIERSKLQQEVERWRVFAEAQRQLATVTSQPEMLARFLRLAEPFADNLAVYVVKAGGLALWKSRGTTAFAEAISNEAPSSDSYFKAMTVRGKTVAAI